MPDESFVVCFDAQEVAAVAVFVGQVAAVDFVKHRQSALRIVVAHRVNPVEGRRGGGAVGALAKKNKQNI